MGDSQLCVLEMCTVEGTPGRRLSGFTALPYMLDLTFAGGAPLLFYFTSDLIITILRTMWRWNLSIALQGGRSRTICQSILSSTCFLISRLRTHPKGRTGPPVPAAARHAFPDYMPKQRSEVRAHSCPEQPADCKKSGLILECNVSHDEKRSLVLFRR